MVALAASASAFPAAMLDPANSGFLAFLEKMAVDQPVKRAASSQPAFNASAQYVSTSGAHAVRYLDWNRCLRPLVDN